MSFSSTSFYEIHKWDRNFIEPFWASGTKLAEMPFWYQKSNSVVKYISCTLYPHTCRSVFNKRVINPNGPLNHKILMNFDNYKTQEQHRN